MNITLHSVEDKLRKSKCFAAGLLLLLMPLSAKAFVIGNFRGLSKLIDAADAIVILRIDNHPPDFNNPTPFSMYECYIYQTLKGDIPKGSVIKIKLRDTGTNFVSPFAQWSTHLMFLKKQQIENEPVKYWTFSNQGANILLSPFGHEKMPEGTTIEEQVRNLIKGAIAYQTEESEIRIKFLKRMLNESPHNELFSADCNTDTASNKTAMFTDELLTSYVESGRALVVVRIFSIQKEGDRTNTSFYYYRAQILRIIMAGDLTAADAKDSLELFTGTSYLEPLAPGSEYALFITKDAPHYLLWPNKNMVIKVDSAQSRFVDNLSERVTKIYESTSISKFRKPADVANSLPELPEGLLSLCEQFRNNPNMRTQFANDIAESDLGSCQTQPIMSSCRIFARPEIPLSRSQAIRLYGEPTLKSGRNYLWYCGEDSNTDRPGEWVGVLSIVFDGDTDVMELRYIQQEKWKWCTE
jgi:hypothetical protein